MIRAFIIAIGYYRLQSVHADVVVPRCGDVPHPMIRLFISYYRLQSVHADVVVPRCGDVPHPGQCLVPTLLDDLQVAHLRARYGVGGWVGAWVSGWGAQRVKVWGTYTGWLGGWKGSTAGDGVCAGRRCVRGATARLGQTGAGQQRCRGAAIWLSEEDITGACSAEPSPAKKGAGEKVTAQASKRLVLPFFSDCPAAAAAQLASSPSPPFAPPRRPVSPQRTSCSRWMRGGENCPPLSSHLQQACIPQERILLV